MKYVITGSTGHISKPLAQKLIAAGHDVTIVSHNEQKRKDIEALGAKAAIGNIEDIDFLVNTFKGADAVYTMVPPVFVSSEWKKYIAGIGKNYAEAVAKAGVKYVVNLSSVGAHLPDGVGPVSGLFQVEKALDEVAGANVRHLRPAYFYNNFLANVDMVKNMGIIGGNYGDGTKIILTHPNDIAEVAAEELLKLDFKGKTHRYIASDEKTTDDVAHELGSAIGKKELKWVNFTDEQSTGGMVQAGLPNEIARNYTEMGAAMRSGRMFEDYERERPGIAGKTKLTDFAKEFSKVYNG